MMREGRGKYADPSSLVRAGAMMLRHIGYPDKAERLEMALDVCGQYEKKLVITGRDTGASARAFGDYLMETTKDPNLKDRWASYVG
jgi:isocitrate/isopropylmalate dehydrogenase